MEVELNGSVLDVTNIDYYSNSPSIYVEIASEKFPK